MTIFYLIIHYIINTTSISRASTCVLFILFMQLVNGTQFLNITFLSTLFASAAAAAAFATVKYICIAIITKT